MSAQLSIYIFFGVGVVAVLMAVQGGLIQLLGTILTLGVLGYFTLKLTSTQNQEDDLKKLRSAYDQMDQQAKLIIQTDLELHYAQEELDRRLAALMSLHRLGGQLEVSLRPEEIFQKLEAGLVASFGFTVGLLGFCQTFESLEWGSTVGVPAELAEQIKEHMLRSQLLKSILTGPSVQMVQTGGQLNDSQQALLKLTGSSSLVVAGIIPHSGPAGCLVLYRPGTRSTTSKADEELVKILVNQLVGAVENSALYEKTWLAQHELEEKVLQRTRELADANAALLRLNKAKSDFVSAVSHELRTPLAAIKGYASLLNSGQFGPLAAPQAERLGKIEKHADLLTQFINNLLDIARIESGRVTMEHRPIAIAEFLATIQELVQPQLQQKHLQFAISRNGVSELFGDPQHLQRVFINLVSNAMKYTPEAGAISINFQREKNFVLATVTDTGSGIPAEDMPKLFQDFYRSSDPINQKVRGTGLGLSLVKKIVEAHNGVISVSSVKGKGTTFTIKLPSQKTEPPVEGGAK